MNLKNCLLGACLVLCGTALGQRARVYVPDANTMLYVESYFVTEGVDETAIDMQVALEIQGELPGDTEPAGRWYLGRTGGYTGPWGPNSTIICGNSSVQCVWIGEVADEDWPVE